MADPLATDEMRRRLALAQDRQQGIGPDDSGRVTAINQWLPFSTNRPGSASWVTEGRNPQWAVPEVLQSGLLGVAGAADAPRTGNLTPETLGLLLTSGPAMGGLLAPRGSFATGAAMPAKVVAASDLVQKRWDNALSAAQRFFDNAGVKVTLDPRNPVSALDTFEYTVQFGMPNKDPATLGAARQVWDNLNNANKTLYRHNAEHPARVSGGQSEILTKDRVY